MKTQTLCLFLLVTVSSLLTAQSALTEHTLNLDKPENAAVATADDFHWLTGRWEGQGFGGTVEEMWNPPLGGTMVGSFRLVNEEGPEFYEFLVLMPEGKSMVYKVKHFNPNLTGWEEKEESIGFPLIKVTQDTAWFQGLTIIRTGDKCVHYLGMKNKEGAYREARLEYTRRTTARSEAEEEILALFPQQSTIPLLMLGSYHMSNPGLDMFNLQADDVQTPKRQAEIQAVVDRLALWQPTKVAIEAPLGDSLAQARYQAYLRGELTLSNSEKEQIGFRLAKQLGHDKIYPIDVRQGLDGSEMEKLVKANPEKYGPYLANLQNTGKTVISLMGKWLQEGSIGAMLYKMNDASVNEVGHAVYFQSLMPIVEGNNYAGPGMVVDWYQRNLHIFSNLHQISDRPDDRIFIVYGAGHIPLLQQFANDSPYFRVDSVQDYLRGL